MIILRLILSNSEKVEDNQSVPNEPWENRQSALISAADKTIPELLEEGKKIIAARPGAYTIACVSAELMSNDGITLGDYWPDSLDFAIAETNGKIFIKGVSRYA